MAEGIIFIDRPLKPNEKSHYYCKFCERYLHPDLAYSHKCSNIGRLL